MQTTLKVVAAVSAFLSTPNFQSKSVAPVVENVIFDIEIPELEMESPIINNTNTMLDIVFSLLFLITFLAFGVFLISMSRNSLARTTARFEGKQSSILAFTLPFQQHNTNTSTMFAANRNLAREARSQQIFDLLSARSPASSTGSNHGTLQDDSTAPSTTSMENPRSVNEGKENIPPTDIKNLRISPRRKPLSERPNESNMANTENLNTTNGTFTLPPGHQASSSSGQRASSSGHGTTNLNGINLQVRDGQLRNNSRFPRPASHAPIQTVNPDTQEDQIYMSVENANRAIQERDLIILGLEAENKAATEEIQRLRNNVKTLPQEVMKTKSRLDAIEPQIIHLQNVVSEKDDIIKTMKAKYDQQRNQCLQLRSQTIAYKNQVTQLQEEATDYEVRLEQTIIERNQLQHDYDQLRTQVADVQKKNDKKVKRLKKHHQRETVWNEATVNKLNTHLSSVRREMQRFIKITSSASEEIRNDVADLTASLTEITLPSSPLISQPASDDTDNDDDTSPIAENSTDIRGFSVSPKLPIHNTRRGSQDLDAPAQKRSIATEKASIRQHVLVSKRRSQDYNAPAQQKSVASDDELSQTQSTQYRRSSTYMQSRKPHGGMHAADYQAEQPNPPAREQSIAKECGRDNTLQSTQSTHQSQAPPGVKSILKNGQQPHAQLSLSDSEIGDAAPAESSRRHRSTSDTTRQSTSRPRKDSGDLTSASEFLARDLRNDSNPRPSDKVRFVDGCPKHHEKICFRCAYPQHQPILSGKSERAKKTVKIQTPIAPSDRMPNGHDESNNTERGVCPAKSLAIAIQYIRDQQELAAMRLEKATIYYNLMDHAMQKRRQEKHRLLIHDLEHKRYKLDQVYYELHNVAEGQKTAGQDLTQDEIEVTLTNCGYFGIKNMGKEDFEEEIDAMDLNDETRASWEGFADD